MTTISAKTILSSAHEDSPRTVLTTLLLRYPRWIHAEGRTHRVLRVTEDMEISIPTPSLMEDENLSRNASSSRAMPVEKLIQDVLDDPAVPLFWGANQKGMQASEECDALVPIITAGGLKRVKREDAWLLARDYAVGYAQSFAQSGYHKQIVNRLLEPFSHITVVVSATEWGNFLSLRDHDDAEPHIRMLAKAIRAELEKPPMQILKQGQWHLPFVTDDLSLSDELRHPTRELMQSALILSTARCASTSYKTVDGFNMTLDRAETLYDKLITSRPIHASPFEHQARAAYIADSDSASAQSRPDWLNAHLFGNFVGFEQHRKQVEIAMKRAMR